MAVDTNELLHRIGAVLHGISDKMDRLIEIGERPAREIQVHEMLEDSGERQTDHFAGADKMVAEEPAKEPEYPVGPMPDPGEGYREPTEKDIGMDVEVRDSFMDPWQVGTLTKILSDGIGRFQCSHNRSGAVSWNWQFARIKIEEPTKEQAEEPPKKWRILEPGEVVCSSDLVNAKSNLPSDPPNGLGWRPAIVSAGLTVLEIDGCIFARPVSEEPVTEPEHPAGPKPDPGEGCCEPTEKGIGGDIEVIATASWINGRRSPAEPSAKEPVPAWEPKVGDWVRVTRPDDWEGCRDPDWLPIMHEYHDKVMQVSSYENRRGAWCAKCDGVGWFFHRDWLTPSIQYFAEPPEIDKPLETEYQRPSLPKDAGKLCEFSDDGESWVKGYLKGFDCDRHWNEGTGWLRAQNFSADRARHRFARIKKES